MPGKILETLVVPSMSILIQTKGEIKDGNSSCFEIADGFWNNFLKLEIEWGKEPCVTLGALDMWSLSTFQQPWDYIPAFFSLYKWGI